MDPSAHITLGGTLFGVWAGFAAGWLTATVRRAWRDVHGYKRAVTNARRSAWRRSWEGLVLGLLLATAVAYALGHG